MTRTKKFFINSISMAVLQLIIMISGFIIPRVMLKAYGSEINGLVASISQFITYFNLVEAGLSSAAIYALYKPLADNDYGAINGIIAAAKMFYNQSGYLFILLTIGLGIIYPVFVKINTLPPINVGLLVLILGVNGALEFFTLSKYRVLLSADQKTYIISIASIIYYILNTLIIITLAYLKVDIVLLRLVAIFSIFIRSFILMIYCRLRYNYIDFSVKPNLEALNKRWDALYLQILGAIQIGAPTIIITFFLDLKVVSVYTIFNMVIAGLGGMLGIFFSGLPASFGDVIARNEYETLQRAYSEFEFLYYTLLTIVYSVTFVTIMPFVRIYTSGISDTNYDLPLIGFLFVLNGLLYNVKTPQGMLVISAGLYKETKLQTTIQGIIVVLVGIVLVPILGLVGVLIASILSNIYRDIDLIFYIPRNLTKLTVRKTFYRIARLFVCILIICTPFLFIELRPDRYISWLAIASGIGLYALIISILNVLIFDRIDMKGIAKRILR